MNNFVFKIFGAPHTFDLYQGSEGDIGYFQNFDNGGKENVKLTIHRMVGGKVSYSYLRYNFISSSGRPNSFFGMSVIFDREYCKDVENVFELFDAVYKGVILKNGILLTELKDNKAAQAKYLVQTFAEADGEVKNVENNIINNLKKHFKGDILPIDSSFLNSNSMVKLNNEMDNARFVRALRKYSWVHISPEYSKNEEPIPSDELVSNLNDDVEEVNALIAKDALGGVNVQSKARHYFEQTNASLEKIYAWLEDAYKMQKGANPNSYLQKQPKLKEPYEKLLEIQKRLKGLPNVEGDTAIKPKEDSSNGAGGKTTSNPIPILQSPAGSNLEPPNPNTELEFSSINSIWEKHKPKIITGVVVFIAILIFYMVIPTPPVDREKITNMNSTSSDGKSVDELIELGNKALDNKDFDMAITIFGKAGKTDLVHIAKSKAIQYLNEQAANAKTPGEAIDFLEKTKKYDNNPTNDIAEYQMKIDQQIASSIAAAERRRQEEAKRHKKTDNKQEESAPTNPTYIDVKIKISPKKHVYSVGERFEATAESGTTTCTGGEWQYEKGLYAEKTKNPTTVEIVSVPPDGKVKLRYYVGGVQKAGIEINIVK